MRFVQDGDSFSATDANDDPAGESRGGKDKNIVRLPPPALRRVTECLALALKSANMTEVIRGFLADLPIIDLHIFSTVDLPFTAKTQFLGSSSPSGLAPGDAQNCIWATDHRTSSDDDLTGFPSAAQLVMLPGLANVSLLTLLAKQKPAILYTLPIRNLLDAMRRKGIQTRFYWQMAGWLFNVFCYVWYLSLVVGMEVLAENSRAKPVSQAPWRSNFIKAGALMVAKECEDVSLSREFWFGLTMVAACITVVLATYYLYREINEMLDVDDGDDAGDSGMDLGDSRHHTWHSRMYGDDTLEDSEWDENITPLVYNHSIVANARHKRFRITTPLSPPDQARGEAAQGDIQEHSDTRQQNQGQRPPPRILTTNSMSLTAVVEELHQESVAVANASQQNKKTRRVRKAVRGVIVAHRFKNAEREESIAISSRARNKTSVWHERSERMSFYVVIQFKEIAGRLAATARLFNINPSYFKAFWNWLALVALTMLYCTYFTLIDTWYSCSVSVCKHVNITGHTADDVWVNDAEDVRCHKSIGRFKLCAAIGTPAVFVYTLYYLRGFDSLNFYTRMIFQIICDMGYFMFIVVWLMLAFTGAVYTLQCHNADGFGNDSNVLRLFNAMGLLLFDTSQDMFEFASDEHPDACDSHYPVLRHMAILLFWGFTFFLVLIALNALIAIMGNSYQVLQDGWQEHTYKTWAEITADMISQWPSSERLAWERQFYWFEHVFCACTYI